jgi:hypothetical protein
VVNGEFFSLDINIKLVDMGFAVMHVQKGKGGTQASGLGDHIDRKKGKEKCYKHADPSRLHLNKQLGNSDHSNVSLQEAINNNISKYYQGKKEIRKDAVKSLNHILTGSHEDMIELFKDKDKKLNWVRANYDYICDNFGKENIVRFTLHLDEKTPHIHCVTTPITKDGRLSAKEMIGNNANLERLQDDYANRMAKFGLKRGFKSNREHVPTKEFYKYVSSAAAKPQVKKHIEKHLNNVDVTVNFRSRIDNIVDKKEISVFGVQKAKNELKMEISQFVNETFEKAKTILKKDLITESMQGFDILDQTNANFLAEEYAKQKDKLQEIRMEEWRKELAKIKPEIEQKTEIDRPILRR